jgi:hypothetical protein
METSTVPSQDNHPTSTQQIHRKKARRGPRAKPVFKPYSELTWQERKALEAFDAEDTQAFPAVVAAISEHHLKRRIRRHRVGREQPPPAPIVTTQQILAERLSPKDPVGDDDDKMSAAVPAEPCLSISSDSSSTSDAFFDNAFTACFYGDLKEKTRDELIEMLLARDREIEALRAELDSQKSQQ